MAVLYYLMAVLSVVTAAPQSPRAYQQSQVQQLNALDYYLDNPEVANYYQQNQQEQKRASENSHNNAPARLEDLDPNTEVELIPGGGQPQQPPQQTPLVPNVPGIIPGQRVFITYMPIPGYRPGTVGGYQPVYIVAAGPQGAGGYQNPLSQGMPPALGFQPGIAGGQINPNFYLGHYQPYKLAYQEPVVAYQPIQRQPGNEVPSGVFRLSQVVSLQGQQPQPHPADEGKRNVSGEVSNIEQKSASTQESKEQVQNPKPSQTQRKV